MIYSWRIIAAWLECFPEKPRTVSEGTGLSGKAKSVKRFKRSNGLDTALYKNYRYLFYPRGPACPRLPYLWPLRSPSLARCIVPTPCGTQSLPRIFSPFRCRLTGSGCGYGRAQTRPSHSSNSGVRCCRSPGTNRSTEEEREFIIISIHLLCAICPYRILWSKIFRILRPFCLERSSSAGPLFW